MIEELHQRHIRSRGCVLCGRVVMIIVCEEPVIVYRYMALYKSFIIIIIIITLKEQNSSKIH